MFFSYTRAAPITRFSQEIYYIMGTRGLKDLRFGGVYSRAGRWIYAILYLRKRPFQLIRYDEKPRASGGIVLFGHFSVLISACKQHFLRTE